MNYIATFVLEQSREPISERANTVYPYTSADDLSSIILSFQYNVNFWYPTMPTRMVHELSIRISNGDMDSSTNSTLAFLILALGCASQYIETFYSRDQLIHTETQYHMSRKSMADMYFDGVLKSIHVAHMEMSPAAAQCLFLVA